MFEIPVVEIFRASPWALLILIVPILPNLWAILHIFRCDFNTAQEKLAWLGVSVFIPFIGGLLYLFVGRRRGTKVC